MCTKGSDLNIGCWNSRHEWVKCVLTFLESLNEGFRFGFQVLRVIDGLLDAEIRLHSRDLQEKYLHQRERV